MDLFEVISRRRSVRAFAPEAVEARKVAQVLAAANAAPSAGNLQGYEIFRVTHEKERTPQSAMYRLPAESTPTPWGQ